MGLKFRGLIGPKIRASEKPTIAEKQSDVAEPGSAPFSKEMDPTVHPTDNGSPSEASIEEKKDLPFGVQVAEATLQVWSKQQLIGAYIL